MNVIRYGMMRAQILGLEAVLADGTVISSMNWTLKNNSGYDLKQLFIGTEGTLGIVTRLVVALKELHRSVNTALIAVDGGENLLRVLKEIDGRLGGYLSSFEAMWGDYFREVTAPGWHSSPFDRVHEFYVIVEMQGPDPEDDSHRFQGALQGLLEAGRICDAMMPKSGPEHARIWAIREDFSALQQYKPLFLYDVSVPLHHMLPYVDGVKRRLQIRWPDNKFFVLGHLGDGNLHFFVSPGANGDERQLHVETDEIVYRPLAAIQGSISAEHGIGLEKKTWLSVSRSPSELELMRKLKRALDPGCILNRGKVIEV